MEYGKKPANPRLLNLPSDPTTDHNPMMRMFTGDLSLEQVKTAIPVAGLEIIKINGSQALANS